MNRAHNQSVGNNFPKQHLYCQDNNNVYPTPYLEILHWSFKSRGICGINAGPEFRLGFPGYYPGICESAHPRSAEFDIRPENAPPKNLFGLD